MDLTVHPKETNMSFLDPISGAWASISGTASVISDPAVVKKYYSPSLKAWLGDMGDGVHDGGPSDPRIGVIKLKAKLATHVVAHKGVIGRAYETVKGAVQGSVPDVNGIRELSMQELHECRFSFSSFWLSEYVKHSTNKSLQGGGPTMNKCILLHYECLEIYSFSYSV
jgi:hypothetical protein